MNIIIVGAGIGGLVSALCLHKKGYKVEIYEQVEALSELGAGVQLSPNATRVLNHLDLFEDLEPYIFEPNSFQFLNYSSGKIITERKLGEAIKNDFNSPNYDIHRADLQKVLLDKIEAENIDIHTNMKVTSVGNNKNSAFIEVEEKKIEADLIIGADGILSLIHI